MAEEINASAVADAPKPDEVPTPSTDAIAEPAVAEARPAEDGIVATDGVGEVPKADDAQDEPAAKEEASASAQPETGADGDDADAVPATDAPSTNGTPAAKKASNGKRKSGTGIPEHKKKTPAKGKKKAPELRLNVNPGEMYMVAMRGYQPWPVIICDEDMLPESLISKRPVSAKQIDGTYRPDFLEGGKNAKDRRYPVMFLGTNEFAWQVNTDLLTFNLEDVKKDVEEGNNNKKNKALWKAWQIAAEGHDLAHFKQVLANHEAAMAEDLEQREQKELEKKEKAEKAVKRKSTAAAPSDDVEMQDGDDATLPSAKKAKGNKKRKKGEDSDGENDKPTKTPKTKLKLTTKTPKDASAAKPKKEPKSKKKGNEDAEPEEPPMTEEERLAKREKQVLYLRHRLQKGFLSRDQAPKEDEMANMSDYLKQLELHEDLEAEVIKKTKVHKVLKAIIKLNSIPKEEDYNFKYRSSGLLTKWSTALTSDGESGTNGVKHEDDKPEVPKEESPVEKVESSVEMNEKKQADTPAEPASTTSAVDTNGDVTMAETDQELNKDEPAIKADPSSVTEASAEAMLSVETAPRIDATDS